MDRKFDYFVLFGAMRTGSNFLEASLNDFDGITCHGEVFNRYFIGRADKMKMMGISLEERNRDPLRMIRRMQEQTEGLVGFRFFHDHDSRVFTHVLQDPRCAKIILTRNPLDSYVSRKIAAATGQWKLGDLAHQKTAKVAFDLAEFEHHLDQLQSFQLEILRGLQLTGQTGFYIGYDDIQDVAVLNGLAAFLGVNATVDAPSSKLKKQNPQAMSEKVLNPEEMERGLARLDRFDLSRTPNFEPRRGAAIPSFLAAGATPLLYMPVRCGPERQIMDWLAALDGTEIRSSFTQKSIRQWKQKNPGHRSFTVVRHPLDRAHAAFCETILSGKYAAIARVLKQAYSVPLPEEGEVQDAARHREAFLAFLRFLKGNLAGQSSVRVDSAWASQVAVLQGFSNFVLPDVILREEELPEALEDLAVRMGRPAPELPAPVGRQPFALAEIHDEELEAAARDAYPRDYLHFGFGSWRG